MPTPNIREKYQHRDPEYDSNNIGSNNSDVRWQQVKSNNIQSNISAVDAVERSYENIIPNVKKSGISQVHVPLRHEYEEQEEQEQNFYEQEDEDCVPMQSARKVHSSPVVQKSPRVLHGFSADNRAVNSGYGNVHPVGQPVSGNRKYVENQIAPIIPTPRSNLKVEVKSAKANKSKTRYEEDEWSEDEAEADMRYNVQYNSYDAHDEDEYSRNKPPVNNTKRVPLSSHPDPNNHYSRNEEKSSSQLKQSAAQRFISPLQTKPTNVPVIQRKENNLVKAGQNIIHQNTSMESIDKQNKIQPPEVSSPEKRRLQGQQQSKQLFNDPEEQLFFSKQHRAVDYK